MEWNKFNTHGESTNHAFEVMCNILFEKWCRREHAENISYFTTVNGSGGDGGLEAYCILKSGEIVGVQSKWFLDKLDTSQITQIKNSFLTAIKVRPNIVRYIVCIPRDLGSIRIVKGGNISKNNEENKWNVLLESLKKKYPNVIIELWNDTKLCSEIQRKESIGSQKYWFGTDEIIEDKIKLSIDKARASWGKTRYIPDIFTTGYIHEKIERFLGSRELSQKRSESIKKVIRNLIQLKTAYEDILDLPEKVDENISEKISLDINIIEEWILKFEQAKEIIFEGGEIYDDFYKEPFRLLSYLDEIKKSGILFKKYFHLKPVENSLNSLYENIDKCINFIKGDNSNRMLFLGNPGTGKTAGIISEVVSKFESKEHIPVLIRARDFSDGDTWKTILEKTLGLSNELDEYDLFQTLEIASQNRRTYDEDTINKAKYTSKCFICVDGIDEAPSFEFWKSKIDESSAFNSEFPHIKFIFLSRPFVFEPLYKYSNKNIIRRIPASGDVSVKSLFEDYCNYYNIDVVGNEWICGQLKTPLSLKIFCELYKGRNISGISENSLIITELFKNKIEHVENIFRGNGKEAKSDAIIKNSLIKLSALFLKKKEIEYSELINELKSDAGKKVEEVLIFLESEGFIRSYLKDGGILEPSIKYYSWEMQPTLDYLIAEQILKTINDDGKIERDSVSLGTFQMLSILLLERKNKFIFEVEKLNLYDYEKFELICYALVNVSSEIAAKYKEYVKNLMKFSVYQFRTIVEKIILPCSKVKEHRLGGILLDEFLREFDNTAERDIWWSVPVYLTNEQEGLEYSIKEVDFENFEIDLNCGYKDWPLVYAWRLSSTKNSNRNDSRVKLLEWGMQEPEEFYKLFEYCNDIDDPQVIEDIYAVSFGICLAKDVSLRYLKVMSNWILDNVFSDEGLLKYRSFVVRYYSRSLVEIAIKHAVQDDAVKGKITPPYKVKEGTWPEIAIEAIDTDRMCGYGPINYDLARYVLSDNIDSSFFHIDNKTRKYSKEARDVLNYYSNKAERDSIKISGLVVALAYKYLLNCGWNKEQFNRYGKGQPIGIDIAIKRSYSQSTHGVQSSVMTVAEKYVWCALHMIEAFLSDLLPAYSYDRRDMVFVDNYCELESFINVYQDYINLKKENNRFEEWFHVDQLCNTEGIKSNSPEKIIKSWINKDKIPNFLEWITKNNEKIMIYSFTDIKDDEIGIKEAIWISSGFVKKSEFKDFISSLDNYHDDRYYIMDVSEFNSHQNTYCYYTPSEACVIPGRKEIFDSIEIGNIKAMKAITRCITTHNEKGEKTFYLPSDFTRKLFGITYGDGYEYFDKDGKVICQFLEVGEIYESQQETLLVDTNVFEERIKNSEYWMFWIFRQLKEPSLKATEHYGDGIYCRSDRTFIVWFDGDKCVSKELFDVKQPKITFDRLPDFMDNL